MLCMTKVIVCPRPGAIAEHLSIERVWMDEKRKLKIGISLVRVPLEKLILIKKNHDFFYVILCLEMYQPVM